MGVPFEFSEERSKMVSAGLQKPLSDDGTEDVFQAEQLQVWRQETGIHVRQAGKKPINRTC